jgi:hypothetical protein
VSQATKDRREEFHRAWVRSRDEAYGAAAAHWRGTYDRADCVDAFLEDAGRERWVVLMRASWASNPAVEFAVAVERGGDDDRMRVTDDTLDRDDWERRRRCAEQ